MSAAVDIGLDTATDDLPDVPELITGTPMIQQQIGAVVNLFLGEWYLDQRIGLPILQWVTEKAPDVQAIGAKLEQEIRTIPGVVRIENTVSALSGRTLSVTMDVVTREGDVIRASILQDDAGLRNSAPWAVYFRAQRINTRAF